MTASFIKSLGLFLIFSPILTMLEFGCSPLVLLFPSPQVPAAMLWWLYQACQWQLISPPLSCSIVFSILLQGLGTYHFFRFPSVVPSGQPERQSLRFGRFSLFLFFFFFFFLLTITRSYHLVEIRWSQRILWVSFSWTDSGLCIYYLFVWSSLNFWYNSL